MVPEAGAFFGRRMTWNLILRCKRSVTPNVLRSIAVSLRPDCFEEAGKIRRLATMKAAGINGCQERYVARSLITRNSTEHLVESTIGRQENPFFSAHGVNTTLPDIYDMILCWFQRGWCFCMIPSTLEQY